MPFFKEMVLHDDAQCESCRKGKWRVSVCSEGKRIFLCMVCGDKAVEAKSKPKSGLANWLHRLCKKAV